MKFVLLSGGSGERLWPLSNDTRSKQFLKLLRNDDGELESMLQRVWRQLAAVQMTDDILIATNKAQVELIQSQLGHRMPLIIEPDRRNTFAAIALATTYLNSELGVDKEEVICVLPVDPFVDEFFFSELKNLEKVLIDSHADLALVGVKPTFPSEKYGYVIPERDEETFANRKYMKVSYFKEKPNEEMARELIKLDAYWNCGVFAFKLNFLLSFLSERKIPTVHDELLQKYDQLQKISFDHMVVENLTNIVLLPYHGAWKDIGTWDVLTEEIDTKVTGRGVISSDSRNTHLINELGIPAAVLGVPESIVAISSEGVLVANKADSVKIKEYIKNLKQRQMYEERRWGWYRVLDYSETDLNSRTLTKKIRVHAGKNLSYQFHSKRSEVWTIIFGEGEFILNEKIRSVKIGDVLQIPVGSKHGIKAITDLEFIEVQIGSDLTEEDITRITLVWEEVISNLVVNQKKTPL
jgi:mannose-1-phosphate guanylyltransferase